MSHDTYLYSKSRRANKKFSQGAAMQGQDDLEEEMEIEQQTGISMQTFHQGWEKEIDTPEFVSRKERRRTT
jgi:hypothetical protein